MSSIKNTMNEALYTSTAFSKAISKHLSDSKNMAQAGLSDFVDYVELSGDAIGREAKHAAQYAAQQAKNAGDYATKTAKSTAQGAKNAGKYMGRQATDFKNYAAGSVIFPALGETTLLAYLGKLTESAATKYDKALDRTYLETHIGGSYHRLVDGGHDLFGAWDRVREAAGDDTFTQQVIGYVSALWKDATTVRGLPFNTVSKDSFDTWAEKLSVLPGVDKRYLNDLLSFDAIELLSSTLGVVGVVYCLKSEDQKKLSELLGSLGITAIISANPLMGIMLIGTCAHAYGIKKMELDKTSLFKSSLATAFTISLFSVLGFPFLINFVFILVLNRCFSKFVLDNDKLHAVVSKYWQATKEMDLSQITLSQIMPEQSVFQELFKREYWKQQTQNVSGTIQGVIKKAS